MFLGGGRKGRGYFGGYVHHNVMLAQFCCWKLDWVLRIRENGFRRRHNLWMEQRLADNARRPFARSTLDIICGRCARASCYAFENFEGCDVGNENMLPSLHPNHKCPEYVWAHCQLTYLGIFMATDYGVLLVANTRVVRERWMVLFELCKLGHLNVRIRKMVSRH